MEFEGAGWYSRSRLLLEGAPRKHGAKDESDGDWQLRGGVHLSTRPMTGMVDLPVGGEGGRPCAYVWIIDGEGGREGVLGVEDDGWLLLFVSKVELQKLKMKKLHPICLSHALTFIGQFQPILQFQGVRGLMFSPSI